MAFKLMCPAFVGLTLAACSSDAEPVPNNGADVPDQTAQAPAPERPMPQTDAGMTFPSGKWQMVSSGEGDGLSFEVGEGDPGKVHLFCASGKDNLLVNVSTFQPVGSEERMTIGSGGEVVTLVADPAGDDLRGGVSGQGPVPEALRTMLTGSQGLGVNYGAQDFGPLPPDPASMASDFARGCTD